MVQVGGYVLEPGDPGTTIRSEGGGASSEAEPLQRAFAETGPPKAPGSAFATEVDEASQSTAKIERAVALCKGIGEGKALDPAQLGLEVGALLDCLERLDRKKEHKKSIQMARALASLLMLLKRWADLLQTLRSALRAAEQIGDQETIAWAKHELGTLRLVAGDVREAERDLRQAREIRQRIGDRRGLGATERNLQVFCERLQEMLRKEELVSSQSGNGRTVSARLIALAAVLATVVFGAGLAVGMTADESPSQKNVAKGVDPSGGPGGGSVTSTGTEGKPEAESFPVTLSVAGEGRILIEGTECGPGTCQVDAGETVNIVAQSLRGWEFTNFSGSCSGTNSVCPVTVTAPVSVTANFRPIEVEPTTDTTGEPPAEEETVPPPEEEGE